MEITEAQYERIKDALPVQRGNVRLSNLQVLNVVEQGCQWRGLPKRFGGWHTIYADESLVEERRSGPGVREVTGRTDRSHQDRSCFCQRDLAPLGMS